ncbi:MAG: hypothetical protein JRJ49_03315 [Deltaproteobacteria bacterium]|nr:hypothetical protein [Deltaproteobacteria bacterium]
MYFETSGRKNTENTVLAAKKRAEQLNIKEIVIASTSGETAYKALEIFKDISLTVVTYHCGFKKPFESVMKEGVKKNLIKKGASVVSATHALSGVERSIFKKFSGAYPVLIMADTLRLFGQGTKVAVEIAIMAADAGALSGKDIISIGGTGKGADTALVLKPAGQSDVFDMKIREVICKPANF